jgi:CCR4-NOT transcription complex subunit 3
MIDNGNLKPEQVDEIKEDVKYYIDSHQEDDFEEDELIYDDLNLEEAEVYGFGGDDDEAPEPERILLFIQLQKLLHGRKRNQKKM